VEKEGISGTQFFQLIAIEDERVSLTTVNFYLILVKAWRRKFNMLEIQLVDSMVIACQFMFLMCYG